MATPKKAKKKDAVVKKSNVKKTSVKKSSAKNKKVSNAQPDKIPEKKPVEKKSVAKKVVTKKDDTLLVFGAVMVINEVKSLHEDLLKLSESNKTVTLDASKVEAIDTAVFQLLLAFVSTMNSKSVNICWKSPSEEFLERATLLNLIDGLNLDGVVN